MLPHGPDAGVPGKWERYRQRTRRDHLAAVSTALDRLPERDRLLLTLHLVDGRTEDEIADLFRVAQGTVSRWLATARGRLRRAVILVLICDGYDREELPV